jgi:hypothetical protein
VNALTARVLNIARGFVGVREVGGNNRGPQVEAWLKRVGRPPGDSWCMACQWSWLDDACAQMRIANVIRPCSGVVRMFGRLPAATYLDAPIPGCWGFHADTDNPGLGHIVLVDALGSPSEGGVFTIEGNTTSEGARESKGSTGGVWRHTPSKRPLSYFNLGFRDYSVLFARQLAA